MTKTTATLVRRASHVHHVPHVGLPQMAPVAMFTPRKTVPTSQAACASRSAASRRRARYTTDATNPTVKAR